MDNMVTTDDVDDEDLFADEILDLINDGDDDHCVDNHNLLNTSAPKVIASQTGLQLIDDNVDLFCAKEVTTSSGKDCEVNGHSRVRELFGDMSDDEGVDNESKPWLSREGREIEANLKTSHIKESTSISLFNTKIRQNVWTKNNKSTKHITGTDEQSVRDVFSGIRLINPLISSDRMRELMSGRKMVKMSLIKSNIDKTTNDIEGDWVTIGIVINKLTPKMSKNGKQYSIWKLSDLKTKKVVSFFLFGDVYTEHWKLATGSVIGLLNGRIMPGDKDNSKYGKNELCAITIDAAAKLMLLGTAKDLGHCKAMKKNQEVCGSIINLAEEDFCVFHVRNAYKNFSARRAEIQTTFSNVEPKKYGTNAANNEAMFCNAFSDGQRKDAPIIETKTFKSKDLKAKRDVETQSLSKIVKNPMSKAAQNLALTCADVKISNAQKNVSISAKDVFASIKRETNGRGFTTFVAPALAKGYKLGDMIDLNRKSDPKLRAIQALKAKPIIAKDPNDIKPNKSKRSLDRIKSKIASELKATVVPDGEDGDEEEECRQKRMRTDLIDKALSRRSVNESGVETAEAMAHEKYFATLETKEKMENKLSEITEMECQVVSCHECKYTAHSASDLCKKGRHKLVRHKATKRFFKCKGCKSRSYTFNLLMPAKGCSKCGQLSYAKTSMVNIKEETTLMDNKLLIRGEEIKFLNSMR